MTWMALSYGKAVTPAPLIEISQTATHALVVDVNDMPTDQVLAALSDATHTAIRFHSLPTAAITRHCKAASLIPMLQCLLGDELKLVQSPQGVWLLDSDQPALPQPKTTATVDVADRLQQLHQQLLHRQSLSMLQPHHRSFYSVIEAALASSDPAERVQAVAKLATLNNPSAEALLYQALMDTLPAVRLQAVDSAEQWPALLALASQDRDATVRDLAVLKLQPFKQ